MQNVYRFASAELRRVERELVIDGRPAAIGSRAFDVLLALLDRRDRMVSKNELLDLVWPNVVVEENNLQAQVSALRKALGPAAIATIPGRGYRFALSLDDEVATGTPPAEKAAPPPTPENTNLPAASDAPFGRDADIAAVTQLLSEHRLVTVLGTGGIGKTRLAQEVARRQVASHLHGVWWVDLAALSASSRIAPAIANAAHLQLEHGDTPEELAQALAHRETMLVLDNCEHVAAEVAHFAGMALDAATGLRILATSQEALKTPGEYLYRLDALAVPPRGTTLAGARKFGAIQLLEERARAVDRHYALTESNIADAIELCRHLDGIALAIEMAAVRVPVLGLEALLARLAERLKLLRGANRLMPARQQTLRATLDWSHSLLNAEEQAVLRRLSAFAGSFRLELAQEIASGGAVDEWAALDALTALVDRSLVQVERTEPPRYRLLETTRLYAAERLAEHGESEDTFQRHSEAMATLGAEASRAYWETPDQPWLLRYGADYDDLEAAFERACAAGNAAVGAPTCEALFAFDRMRGQIATPRRRAAAVHAMLASAGPLERARLWNCIGRTIVAIPQVSLLDATRERVAAWRQVGNPLQLYLALGTYASACARGGDLGAAERAFGEADALEDPGFPPRVLAEIASDRVSLGNYRNDGAAYRAGLRLSMQLSQKAGADAAVAGARRSLADAALMAGEVEEAVTLGRAAVADPRVRDRPRSLAVALSNLNAALLMAGNLSEARITALEAVPLAWQTGIAHYCFDHVALYAVLTGAHAIAAQLLGFADHMYATGEELRQPNEARSAGQAGAALDAALGAAEHARLRAAGAACTPAQADALAHAALEAGS